MTRLTGLDVPDAWEAVVIDAFGDAPQPRLRTRHIGIAAALVIALLASIAGVFLIVHR
jgi:hypothetical protein